MAKRHAEPYRLFKRGEIYHAYISYISETGERIRFRESTGAVAEQDAIKYCIERIAELQKKAKQQATGELPSITINEAFARYFIEKGQFNSRPKQTLTRLNNIKNDIGVEYLHQITEITINNLIAKYRNNLSNSTINRYLALISVILNVAEFEWRVKTYRLKMQRFKLKEPAENIKFLKDWSVAQRIIDGAADHLKPIIYTALYTGLRESNILNLKWENIDFANNTITVKVKDRTKQGGKNHTIPIIGALKEILENQPRTNEYVFNFRGKPIKSLTRSWHNIFYEYIRADKVSPDDVVENRWIKNKSNGLMEKVPYKRVLRDVSLPYTNFHTLRHTAATWILKKTNNLRITKEILGHADIKTTLKYAHVLDDEKRSALNSVFN